MINQTTKPKAKTERPALKVMHHIVTDENGKNPVMTSRVLEAAPKLKEAVDSAKLPPIRKPSTQGMEKDSKPKDQPKAQPKGELSDEQRSVLKALHDLGGKDVHSMDIAKRLGFDKTHKNAPRAPVRHAMKALHALHFVTSKKEGAKFSFSITDKGKEALNNPAPTRQDKDKDVPKAKAKEAGGDPAPQPSTSERPANTDIQCSNCQTWNPYMAEFCKNCGKPIKAALTLVAA